MSSYKTSFVAPSSEITLFVRAWKKWGTARKELDVNLDDITLEATGSPPASHSVLFRGGSMPALRGLFSAGLEENAELCYDPVP